MDTATHAVIQTEDGPHIIRPVSIAYSQPAAGEQGTWMLVAFSEDAGDLRTYPLFGSDISALVDNDRERLEKIVAEREANVPTVSEAPAVHEFEEGKNTQPADDLTPVAEQA